MGQNFEPGSPGDASATGARTVAPEAVAIATWGAWLRFPAVWLRRKLGAQARGRRIAFIEELRQTGGGESVRWSDPANHHEAWAERGIRLANYVQPGERVFEFGAGRSALRAALPSGCAYTGSDNNPLRADVVKYDLNAAELSPIADQDVAAFSGVLEYVHDLPRLAHFLAANFSAVVCSYAGASKTGDDIEARRGHGWFNDLTEEQFLALFETAGFRTQPLGKWLEQSLYRFDRRDGAAAE